MKIEYMLAERTARYEKGSRSTVMMRLASVTVGLGIAVMIITLSVVAGFRQQINGALRGMMADMTICDVSGFMRQESEAVRPSEEFVREVGALRGVKSISPQVVLNGMAKSGDNVAGLQLKGIDAEYATEWWQSVIVEGSLPDVAAEHRGKELLLSEATAQKLDVAVGDERPRRDRFKVSGIYRTGLEEMDLRLAVADMRDVRRIAGWADDEVSGYDVMLDDGADVEAVSDEIFQIIDRRYDAGDESVGSLVVNSIRERFPVVYDWLKAHNINARVIIVIIMVVVLFNMAAAMLIMVLDRTAMIGSLKALGMRNGAIRRMFIYRAARLFAVGALWGNVVALVLVGVQAVWHPVELNPSGYMLTYLPVKVELWRVVLLNVGALAVTVVVMLLPSAMIARISPSESLKYKL